MPLIPGIMHHSAGPVSFMRAPYCNLEDIPDPANSAIVVGVPTDSGTSMQCSCRLGPRAIREASTITEFFISGSPSVEIATGRCVRRRKEQLVFDVGDIPIDMVDLEKNVHNISEGLSRIAETGALAVSLGGDHSITFPCFWGVSKGLSKKKNKIKMGHIHMDAHLDLHDAPNLTGKYGHASCCRRISELDCVNISNMVWIGARGTARPYETWEYMVKNGAHFLSMDQVRKKGIVKVAQEALELASKSCDAVYLSVDTDVLDICYAPGTSCPTPGGITAQELLDAMTVFSQASVIRAMDITELSPDKDTSPRDGITAQMAAETVASFLAPKLLEYC